MKMKIIQSSSAHPNDEDQKAPWLQNPWRKDTIASTKNMMNQGKLSPVTICMYYHFALYCDGPLNSPYICLGL